jgi:hypothetical protein
MNTSPSCAAADVKSTHHPAVLLRMLCRLVDISGRPSSLTFINNNTESSTTTTKH